MKKFLLESKFINKTILFFLRIFYAKIDGAKGLNVLFSVFFMQKIVGFNRLISWPVHFTSRVIASKNITLGKRSFPGWSQGCYIQAKNGIVIGCNLRMGPNVGLISANHELDDYDSWKKEGPIHIGDNVWLGMNVVVLPGVKIGNNVVVASNSVVNKDIPSNTIAGGIPAKALKEKEPYLGLEYSNI